MVRLVVTNNSGEIVRDLRVNESELVSEVIALIEALPDYPTYVEGDLLPPQQRASLLYQAAQVRQARDRSSEDMTPAQFEQTAGIISRSCDDIRRAQIQSVRELGQAVQAVNKSLVEDAVKQRFMLHQSLDDIDLIDRSAKIIQLQSKFSATPLPMIESGSTAESGGGWRGFVDRMMESWATRYEGE